MKRNGHEEVHRVAHRVHSHRYRRPGSPNERLARRLDRICKGSWALLAQARRPHNARLGRLTFLCALACLRMLVGGRDGRHESGDIADEREGGIPNLSQRTFG